MIFDLLHADGRSLLDDPYVERRTRLNALNPAGPAWQTHRDGSVAAPTSSPKALVTSPATAAATG